MTTPAARIFAHASWCLGLAACSPGGLAVPVSRLEAPAEVDLGVLPFAETSQRSVALTNLGAADARVTLSTGAPFSLVTSHLELAAGASELVTLTVRPDSYAPLAGVLELTTDREALSVALLATVDADADADGHSASAAGGDDCDDADAQVHPGASEVCDGTDNDCNGAVDDVAEPPVWYADRDGDGYGDAEDSLESCEQPTGYADTDGDCDDSAAAVNPGADEQWYDGVDQDCAGDSDYDQDGDGHDATEHGGDDCADANPAIGPDVEDPPYDGVDQDCGGGSDFDADGDGEDALPWGADCDDADSSVAPGAPEADDGVDQDCDGMVDEDFVARGDLVLSEVLVAPLARPAVDGQYVELHNVSAADVSVTSYVVSVDGAERRVGALVVAPGGVALLCTQLDAKLNGGLSCDGEIAPMGAGSWVELRGALVVDELDLGILGPLEGAAWELTDGAHDADLNDDPSAWCVATADAGSGDLGTPGALPASCP